MANPTRLGKRAFFAIISDAVYQDGIVEPHEKQIMQKVAAFLKLPPELAKDIANRSKERFKRGELGPRVPIDGASVYEHALELACIDGTVDNEEKALLTALRKLFRITPDFHKKTMEKVVHRLKKQNQSTSTPSQGFPEKSPDQSHPEASASVGQSVPVTQKAVPRQPMVDSEPVQAVPPLPASAPMQAASYAVQAASLIAALEGGDGRGNDGQYVVQKKPSSTNEKKTFYLQAGGLPIPFSVNLLCTALAAVILLTGFFAVRAVFGYTPPSERKFDKKEYSIFDSRARRKAKRDYNRYGPTTLGDIGFLVVVALAGGGYWFSRREYEKKLLSNGSKIVVSDGFIIMPGFVRQETKPVTLKKTEIDRVYLGIHAPSKRDREYGHTDPEEGKITSINFALKGSMRVTRFGADCIDNLPGLTSALNTHMGIHFDRVEQSVYDDYGEILIAAGVLVLFAGIVMTFLG